jgi:hypothetical protein
MLQGHGWYCDRQRVGCIEWSAVHSCSDQGLNPELNGSEESRHHQTKVSGKKGCNKKSRSTLCLPLYEFEYSIRHERHDNRHVKTVRPDGSNPTITKHDGLDDEHDGHGQDRCPRS